MVPCVADRRVIPTGLLAREQLVPRVFVKVEDSEEAANTLYEEIGAAQARRMRVPSFYRVGRA